MTGLLAPGANEVADRMADTFDREDLAGSQSRWCPERDAIAVRRWIVDRSRELGGGIRRVVRFARLAAVAGGGEYVRFLYDSRMMPSLRAANFKAALQAARASGRLSQAVATLTPYGVVLNEPAMRLASKGDGAGFDIDFAQMPRVAALLDVLHNCLGYVAVADLLEPILVRAAPRAHADDVARALHAEFNAWLADRLESPHHIRQVQTMRAFLAKRGSLTPEAIDDEAILSSWTSMVSAPADSEVEGFRLFVSAVRALLRYRRALRDSAVCGAIGAPLTLDDDLDHQNSDVAREQMASVGWQSPLRGLASRPANGVKWLTKREWLKLLNYLGGPRPDDEDEEPEADEQEREDGDRGLAGGERFDLRFLRTLVRADVFGAIQAGIVARLRKRAQAATAIEQAMAPATDEAYEACAASYAAVRDQLRLEALAALGALLDQGSLEALLLVDHLAGRDAVNGLLQLPGLALPAPLDQGVDVDADQPQLPDLDEAQRQAITSALQSVARHKGPASDGATLDLLAAAQTAARQVNRIGFRREDRTDPAMLAAFQASVPAVADLLAEIDRLVVALPQAARKEEMTADRPRFEAAFRSIYGAAAPAA